jgi:hypothetical protein
MKEELGIIFSVMPQESIVVKLSSLKVSASETFCPRKTDASYSAWLEATTLRSIENTYANYEEILKYFGEDKVASRIEQIYTEMEDFLKVYDLNDVAYVHRMSLDHAVMDYFSDIKRLKDYQPIERVNEFKIKAYETFWLLKRKPLQLFNQVEDDKLMYVNEKFLLMRLASFMLDDKMTEPLIGDKGKAFKNYLDTLYYYLKFRRCDPLSIELALLAFEAGKII